jgi:SAM-dependent MidA family methyltransferase
MPEDIFDVLRDRIAPDESIGFDEFLQIALYDAQFGYYGSGKAQVGWEGDFFTNVSVSSLYGELLAGQFLAVWERMGCPSPFTIIEQGAHDGRLLADILAWAEGRAWWASLRVVVIEPQEVWRQQQAGTLARWSDKVEWVSEPGAVRAECGVHFSNELVDALPFLRVRREEGRWWESRVGWGDGGALRLVRAPAPASWLEALQRWPEGRALSGADWPEPYETEFRPAAAAWMQATAQCLQRGAWFVCDYGYAREEFFAPRRSRGTLWCYRGHRRDDDALADPGEKDISAHVEFTSLAEMARAMGWNVHGFLDQHHFLVGAAEDWLRSLEGVPPDAVTQKKLRSLQTLLHPDRMGRQFQFLVMERGMAASALPLPCCRHARPVEQALGMAPAEGSSQGSPSGP